MPFIRRQGSWNLCAKQGRTVAFAVRQAFEALERGITTRELDDITRRAKDLHEPPQVPNFGPSGQGLELQPGLVLAIEPMVNVGVWKTRMLDNGWTVATEDGALSCHFEHTVVVTEDGPEILTVE